MLTKLIQEGLYSGAYIRGRRLIYGGGGVLTGFYGRASNASLLNGVLCVLCVLACFRCSRALGSWVLDVLHEIACLACINKLVCLTCFKKLACLWCVAETGVLGVLRKIACLACFIKWRAWSASWYGVLDVFHKTTCLKLLTCFLGEVNVKWCFQWTVGNC